mmetsp:Transcript_20337/g.19308  ORF Transcript_20337/g.19308 Transcript_20337/m.19308 type:complete len:200 (-) Transcript_20337:285-884(-)
MTYEVGQVLIRLCHPSMLRVWKDPMHIQPLQVLIRYQFEDVAQIGGVKARFFQEILEHYWLLGHFLEVLDSHLLHLIDVEFAHHHQIHHVAGIIGVMELQKILPDRRDIESLQASCLELVEGASFFHHDAFDELVHPSPIFAKVLLVLVVYSVHFPVGGAFCEEGLLEELRKDIHSLLKAFILYVEVIVSIVFSCCSIL